MSFFKRTSSTKKALVLLCRDEEDPLQILVDAQGSALRSADLLQADLANVLEGLQIWSLAEEGAFGSLLQNCTNLISQVAHSLNHVSTHLRTTRVHIKTIHSCEKSMKELRIRRERLVTDADRADDTLWAMQPNSSGVWAQRKVCNRLRDKIKELEAEIAGEEERMRVLKSRAVTDWVFDDLGILSESPNKPSIVALPGTPAISGELGQHTDELRPANDHALIETRENIVSVSQSSNSGFQVLSRSAGLSRHHHPPPYTVPVNDPDILSFPPTSSSIPSPPTQIQSTTVVQLMTCPPIVELALDNAAQSSSSPSPRRRLSRPSLPDFGLIRRTDSPTLSDIYIRTPSPLPEVNALVDYISRCRSGAGLQRMDSRVTYLSLCSSKFI